MLELYREHLKLDHNYKFIHIVSLVMISYITVKVKTHKRKPQDNDLYAIKYDVNYNDLDFKTPNDFMI